MTEPIVFRVLGPLEVTLAGVEVTPSAPMQRTLLAALLVDAGAVVSVDRLIDALWGDAPPETARSALSVHVAQVRKHLGGAGRLIETRRPGYALTLGDRMLDSAEFERLVGSGRLARRDGDPATAAVLLRGSESLWRGEAYAEFAFQDFALPEARRLAELRATARADRIAAELDLGEHETLVGELVALTESEPDRQQWWKHLMLALHRSGRQADALAAYRRATSHLAGSGLEPGQELRDLEEAILLDDPSLAPPGRATPASGGPTPVLWGRRPAQLYEREDHLAELHEALTRARNGTGSTLLIFGEAGIGKSALVHEFAFRLGSAARVLIGGCDDLSTPRTLGPFRDMARAFGGGLEGLRDATDRDAFIEGLMHEMSLALRPAVVIVEDAQWADEATLDIIRYLARRIDRLPALMIVTYRDDLTADHALMRLVGTLTPPTAVRMALPGLSDASVTRLAESAGLEPSSLVAQVGGNPLYLTEALAAPQEDVPRSVRDAVLARVVRLPDATREALGRISVVPHRVEGALVDQILEGAAASLDDAERAGMLVMSGGHVAFRHELTRRAIEGSLPETARLAAHRAVLEALEATGADLPRLVHHAVGARDAGAIARHAPRAAEEAAGAQSHHEAAAFGRLALERPELLDPNAVAGLHDLVAYELYMVNRFNDAAAAADRAVAAWSARPDARSELGAALITQARMRTVTADPEGARAAAERAVDILEPLGPGRRLALAYSTLGNLDAVQTRYEAAIEWTQAALDLASRLGLGDVTAHALNYLGVAKVGVGDLTGLDDLERAIGVATEIGHVEYLFRAAYNLAVMLGKLGRHPESARFLEIAEHAAREHDIDYGVFQARSQQLQLAFFEGRWAAAESELRRLLSEEGEPGAALSAPLAVLGRILARRGDPAAQHMIDQAWDIAQDTAEIHRLSIPGAARIEWAWLTRDDGLVRSTARTLLPAAASANHPYLRGEVLRYLVRIGDPVDHAAGCPPAFAAGIAGDAARAAGLWLTAGRPYERALELVESGDPTFAAEGLDVLDRLGATAAIARLGDPGEHPASRR